jgi:hypothetical protein
MFPVKWVALVLFVGLFAGIVISLEVGYRIGRRGSRRIPERGFEGVGAMEAAIFRIGLARIRNLHALRKSGRRSGREPSPARLQLLGCHIALRRTAPAHRPGSECDLDRVSTPRSGTHRSV